MQPRFIFRFLLVLILILAAAPRAQAWGNKEHIQITRLAVMRLLDEPTTPDAMKDWLRQVTPGLRDFKAERDYFLNARVGLIVRDADGLPYWATMPDMMVNADARTKLEPYGVAERLMHFIDLEFFAKDESKRRYAHDLSGKPAFEDVPRDVSDPRYQQAGFLPFRVEECYKQLVRAIGEGKLTDTPGQFPRDDHAAKWAGYLAHYLEDNTQPHHSSIEYKSASYFARKQQAPNVHAEMEYRMNDDDAADFMTLREEFWTIFEKDLKDFKDPVTTKDPWAASLQVSLQSYDALPMVGLAAMAASAQAGTPDKPTGAAKPLDTEVFFRFKGRYLGREMTVMEMKSYQQAWAVVRVATMWRQAWKEATGE